MVGLYCKTFASAKVSRSNYGCIAVVPDLSQKTKIWGALWVVYIVWGSTYLAIELTINSMPPLLGMGTRFLAAAIILALVLALKNGWRFLRIDRKQVLALGWLGSMLLGLGIGMVTLAQFNGVPTGIVALLISALPLWIAIFKRIEGKGSSPLGWIGITIGMAGVLILLSPELRKPDNSGHLFWMAMVILGNIGWALGTYLAPRLQLPKSALVVTTYQMLLGGVSMSIVGLIFGEQLGEVFNATQSSWLWWIYLVLIGSIATYSAYLWLVQNAPVGLTATYAYVNPVIAVTLGALFLGEKLSLSLFMGAVIVIAGVAIVVRVESKAVSEPSRPNV
jgi:drug/metabolite transporter (DMT)-like permease